MKLILVTADFDEGDSYIDEFTDMKEFYQHIDGADNIDDCASWVKDLLVSGEYKGEWHHYHLIEV